MISEVEQAELIRLNDRHLHGNRSEQRNAADEAYRRSLESSLGSQVQAERATQAMVFTTAGVNSESSPEEVLALLNRIVDVIVQNYPVGTTQQKAQEQKKIWGEAFPGRNGYIIALRDMYRAYQMIGIISKKPEIFALAGRIYSIVEKFAQENPEDRDALQFFIQQGTYANSVRALATYKEAYAATNQMEYIQFLAEVLGKALKEQTSISLETAGQLFLELIAIAKSDLPKKAPFVVGQLAKKIPKHVLDTQQRHYKKLAEQISGEGQENTDLSKITLLGKLLLAE